jgi:hypothetical protein
MVAAANTALSATADGNQKKPGFPGFIPPGANPQQVAAALAARTAPNVLAGTGLGMGDPMKQVAPIAPAVGGGLAPAFGSGLYGENARYNALPQDNAKNAGATAVGNVPALPAQPKPASAGVDGIPTGGPAGWAGGAAPQAPKTAFGDMQATIQNQVEKAVWGSNFTPAPSTGLPSAQKPAASPVPAPYRNDGQNYPAGGKAQSPAVTTAPAGLPQRNAAGALTSLGAGTDVVGGIKKYVVDGKTLYSNMGDDGPGGNLSLMNRGAPTAQNMAAMDALVNRSTAEGAQAVQRMQFNDQVAQAKAINAMPNPVDPRAAMDVTSPQYQAARLQNMEMRQKTGESPAAYQTRMQAMAESQRLAQTQASGAAELGLRRDTLAANTKQADARLGIDQQRLGLDGQRLANDQETGSLTRDQKRMEMDQAKKIQALQDKYLTATGAEQEAIGKQLQALAGKESRGDWKLQVTPATKNADGSTSAGSIVRYNERTGAVEQVAGGQGGQAASAGQKYEVGQTVQRADGQKARVIAVDASGQPTKFQPL